MIINPNGIKKKNNIHKSIPCTLHKKGGEGEICTNYGIFVIIDSKYIMNAAKRGE